MGANFEPNNGEAIFIAMLDGSDGWRKDVRDRLVAKGLPTKRDEAWKWSDLRRAARDITKRGSTQLRAEMAPQWADLKRETGDEFSAGALAQAAAHQTAFFRHHLGGTYNIELGASVGASVASVVISLPRALEYTILEHYRAADGALAIANVDYEVGPGAKVNRVVLFDDAPQAGWVLSSNVSLAPGASFTQTSLTFGAKFLRQETRLSHPGQGATATLNGAYLVGAGGHADMTSIVNMQGEGGELDQLTKGIVHSGGRAVFQGKIHVDQAAQKTAANMTHRGMIIDDRSEIDSKPELEIYADDVECSHGNAIGTLDEMALFYMQQRGLPEADARRLLVESFLDETLSAVKDEKTRDSLSGRIAAKLKGLV
ncbi:SufD family Fe-S cluster assembly protein [Hyphobacterium sp. HN65]|uniref:SufD family Fe-S cluster assembly protein n=1 Tax=Hyphobacterium lacteum TaxID=3116575 RepID=A0ABU7LLS1_9PROT|nr:SufD family Fe-S cluster assembly protein [Hyphobacterium sp. HN65]MEE2524833.1 SufD family Fe-S cluster assembly protein [Hyphobacterium sp. HN65]